MATDRATSPASRVVAIDDAAQRRSGDVTGINTRIIVQFLMRQKDPEILSRVMARAGEVRPPDALLRESTTSSYAELRALLEATAEVLGGLRVIETMGGITNVGSADVANQLEAVHRLGSPAEVYRSSPIIDRLMGRTYVTEAVQTGRTEFVLRQRMAEGFEPFRARCAFMRGSVLPSAPSLFGLPMAEVVEERCQCDGAPVCEFRVRWREPSGEAGNGYYRVRAELLEGRLDALQRTVSELVSASTFDQAIRYILDEAERTVLARAYVLVVDPLPWAARQIYSKGLSEQEATEIGNQLGTSTSDYTEMSVAEVRSARRRYGWLAAINDARQPFLTAELEMLRAYARLAAVTLDSATALEDARRAADTAQRLLELSNSLSDVSNPSLATSNLAAVAAKLALAVPGLVACDRSVVVIGDPNDPAGAAAIGQWGYPEAAVGPIHAFFSSPQEFLRQREMRHYRADAANGPLQTLMERAGIVASTIIPIISEGEILGSIMALSTERVDLPDADSEMEGRLKGLAAQSVTAVRNARLRDDVEHRAMHDPLTGLPNRSLILDRLQRLLGMSRRSGAVTGVLYIDLDGFKDINDNLGHDAGDDVLGQVTDRLSSVLRESDSVGRMGGDEFVVLTSGPVESTNPAAIAQRLLDRLRAPYVLDNRRLRITASVGIATATGGCASDLLRQADTALYEAKAAGRNRYAVYRSGMRNPGSRRLGIEHDVVAALDNHQLRLVYQPIFELHSMRIMGLEALLRWRHPTLGDIPPTTFIPALEGAGLMQRVGNWVVDRACADMAAWHAKGRTLDLSVNVSAQQLHGGLLDGIRQALRHSGLDASYLIVEIAERDVMGELPGAAEVLRSLRAIGVRVAIDDFGTAHSSLVHLLELPVDSLKLDGSFVAALPLADRAAGAPSAARDGACQSSALVRTLLALGHALRLDTVAEGIEELDQFEQLRDGDCHCGQGFLLSVPLEVDAVEGFLAGHRPGPGR